MKILILGGTGAMGAPLVKLLVQNQHDVYVTSRKNRASDGAVHYIHGDAHNIEFIKSNVKDSYDVIIDFMIYTIDELKDRIEIFLSNTKQYFFFSSSRVYSESVGSITETNTRILDDCKDQKYISTEEYALAKAREENILFESGYKNWTIIRPYITYNAYRLQLGPYEKEHWLWRALNGRSIVLPKQIAEKHTTMTHGLDVAKCVANLVGKQDALGEIFNTVTEESLTWYQIAELYKKVIYDLTGKEINIVLSDDLCGLEEVWDAWQIKYDRLYNRKFDNSKICRVTNNMGFIPLAQGIKDCLKQFLDRPEWGWLNWDYEIWSDKVAKEYTPFSQIPGKKQKIIYIFKRLL